MSKTDKLISEYADKLQDIYDRRVVGDHTFTGVLSSFLSDYNNLDNHVAGCSEQASWGEDTEDCYMGYLPPTHCERWQKGKS